MSNPTNDERAKACMKLARRMAYGDVITMWGEALDEAEQRAIKRCRAALLAQRAHEEALLPYDEYEEHGDLEKEA